MGKEKKESGQSWRPVHEVIIETIREEVRLCRIVALADVYRKGSKVPLNEIPPLVKELERFANSYLDKERMGTEAKVIEEAINTLQQQEKEYLLRISEKKKREKIKRKWGNILLEDALKAVEKVVKAAQENLGSKYGEPIAVAVVGLNFKLIAFSAMDGVMPVSVDLCIKKAHTAIAGQKETLEWEKAEKAGLDGRNFGDESWTCFGGGVPVRINNRIIGAVGVSGRHSHKEELLSNQEDLLEDRQKIPPQDHELARIGARYLEELYR